MRVGSFDNLEFMTGYSSISQPHLVAQLRSYLIEEISKTLGFDPRGFLYKILWPLIFIPAHRFAQIAAEFDQRVGRDGFPQAASWAVQLFVERVQVKGEQTIPLQGPLIVAANHPGTYDSIAIASCIPRRDLKIIVSGVPFFQGLPTAGSQFLYANEDAYARMGVVREAIRHLQAGGSLLIFPSGHIDPDPVVLPGAVQALQNWSRSLQIFLSRAPESRLVLAAVSGVLAESSLRHPLVYLRRKVSDRQRIAEFVQVMQQIVFRYRLPLTPRITFDQSMQAVELRRQANWDSLLSLITARAGALLAAHMAQADPASTGD